MSEIIKSITQWQQLRQQTFFNDKKIGFVPTMGNLHLGHQSLLARSVKENQITVLSLFVNPTQFDNKNDLAKYPRTFDHDVKLAEAENVDYIFAPEYTDLYPDDYSYRVSESQLSQKLCGKHRPGHFDGVLTIVLKLFNLIKPIKAYFGEKDYQQLQLIKAMAAAFFLDIEIIACPTMRAVDGLALSSRNSRLSGDQYQQAVQFAALLKSRHSCQEIARSLTQLGFEIDYIEEHNGRRYGAVRLGEVRLIDNVATSGL